MKHRREWLEDRILKNNWTHGAELGLWDGRTYLYLLRKCPKLILIGVDCWENNGMYVGTDKWGNVWDHEKHEKRVRHEAKQYNSRAIIYKNYTGPVSKFIEDKSLDFVFIDADHSKEAVIEDILNWRPKIKDNGMLSGHDVNWPGVEAALENLEINYKTGPDNVWYA